mgnify:CR=1 FL=1
MTVHLRYKGESREYTLDNLMPLADNLVLEAVARAADLDVRELTGYTVERGETDIVVHPQAVYG